MPIPRQVQQQAKRAEELYHQVYHPDAGTEGTTSGDKAPEDQADSLPAQPSQETDTPQAPLQAADTFEQKYYTLKGKYDAEVPRLSQQVRDLSQSVRDLTEKLNQKREEPPKPTTPPADLDRLDPQSFEQYGDEFGKLAKKLNDVLAENNQLKQTIDGLTENVNQVKTNVNQVVKTQAHTTYNGYLSDVKKVLADNGHDFDQLNYDRAFLAWLQEPHPFTGEPRHKVLKAAEKALDVTRTMVVFNEYLNGLPKQQQKQTDPASQPRNVQPQPSHGPDTTPQPQQSKRVWSRADITRFYKEKPFGRFNGKPVDEATLKAMEMDLIAAPGEGRIR